MRKVSTEDGKDKRGGRKKGGDDEQAAKPATGLAKDLNMLEERLMRQHLNIEKPVEKPVARAQKGRRR